MKTIVTIILILIGSASMAEPLIMIGVSRQFVTGYMDLEPGYRCIHSDKDSAVYRSDSANITFTYVFMKNNIGLYRTCVEVRVLVPDAIQFISDQLADCRFRMDPLGDYTLNNCYANEPTVRILRRGNLLVYKY